MSRKAHRRVLDQGNVLFFHTLDSNHGDSSSPENQNRDIGGGIAGPSLLFGLLKQPHLEPKLYEAGPEIAGEAGAGVGLAINALKAWS